MYVSTESFGKAVETAYLACDYRMKSSMKTFLMVTCACLLFAACVSPVSCKGTDELHMSVRLTTGERSKDSNSETMTITVERDAIVLERTFGGSGNRRPSPPRKVYKLSPVDKRNMIELIRSNNLLVTDSIELTQAASNYRYFELSVGLTLGEKKGAINISGLRTAVEMKEEQLYQRTLALVEELYRIMNRQDRSIRLEELIPEPKR